MGKWIHGALGFSLVLAGAGVRGAEPPPELKAVIDKAVKATGGDNLAKFKAATWKGKGTFYGLGEGISYTGEWAVQPPEQARIVTGGEAEGKKFQRVLVISNDTGWEKLDDTIEDLSRERLAEEKERLFDNWVTTLAPFKDQAADLAPLGERKINDRPAIGVQATFAGHRPVKLFFDKEPNLLLLAETQVKDPKTGKETAQDVYYSDYKDFAGLKRALKITVKVDDKLYADGELSDFEPLEKLEAGLFAKPSP